MSVSGIGTAGYMVAGYETRRTEKNTTSNNFAGQVSNTANDNNIAASNQTLELQGGGAILSTIHVQTGESIGIYYDEEAGGSLMVAKIKGADGSEKEIKIDPDKVDPSNASYVEMLALSAHLKQQGKIDSPAGGIVAMTMAKRVQEANVSQGGIYDKYDFLGAMQSTLADCLSNGFMDTYVRYVKEVNIYAERASNKNEVSESNTEEKETDYQQIIQEYIEKIFVKLENGETDDTYQIGGSSFTLKEWEEFLNKFDSNEEAIQELMEEEQAIKEAEEAQKENVIINDTSTLITTESTSCTYETADPDDDIRYITWYTEEGIFCRKAGQTEGYEWSVAFKDKEQYDKVMEFIGQFPSDWNMRFAAHENFWNDFLNDEIDMDGFMEFIKGTNKGVPDFSITVGDSMYVDSDKAKWAKYTNPLGARFYTAEEMHRMQMEIIATNEAKLTKLTDWDAYESDYKKSHPEYNGEKICCEYPGGPLYTVKEMAQLQYRKMLEKMGITEEELHKLVQTGD